MSVPRRRSGKMPGSAMRSTILPALGNRRDRKGPGENLPPEIARAHLF